jgi:hypothetical protein
MTRSKPANTKTLREQVLAMPVREFCSEAFVIEVFDRKQLQSTAHKMLSDAVKGLTKNKDDEAMTVEEFLRRISDHLGWLDLEGYSAAGKTKMVRFLKKLLSVFDITIESLKNDGVQALSPEARNVLTRLGKHRRKK